MPRTGSRSAEAGAPPSAGASPKAYTEPSDAAIQYPAPVAVVAMPAIGDRATGAAEPWKRASPKVKMPPSDATSQ